MSFLSRFCLLCCVGMLSACGGGGGTGGLGDDTAETPDTQVYTVGGFSLAWDQSQLVISENGRTVWASEPNGSFVQGGVHELEALEDRGSFRIRENIRAECQNMRIDSFTQGVDTLTIKGAISGRASCESGFSLVFKQVDTGHLQFSLSYDNSAINFSQLVYGSDADERFHGFGEQFHYLDMKGQRVQIISQEGGIFKGREPFSAAVNTGSSLIGGLGVSAGDEYTTYYGVPQYITSKKKSLFLENTELSVFDLTSETSVKARVFHSSMTGRILSGSTMLALIERFTEYTGRMRALPDWFNEGAVIGLQGGTDKVNGILDELQARNTPVSGVWLQDWVGKRVTAAGSQLWWNWVLDENRYPGWNSLVSRVQDDFNGKVLCYINAFLVDATDKEGGVTQNLWDEAVANDYLVKDEEGGILQVANTDFSAGMVDFTHPGAQTWIKDIMKYNMIRDAGCGGWMHDFGEALPYEAHLFNGVEASSYHNQYTVDWARLGREAIEEAKTEGLVDFDVVFFNRAGYTQTPAYSTLLWQGDQMVTWDEYDGLQSAIIATLTGGFSGLSLNHSDIGGYTNVAPNIFGFDVNVFNREQELLLRWMEYSAFTVAYRTHEGIKPETNAQFYDVGYDKFDEPNCKTRFSEDINYQQFDKFARVYKALAFYRRELMTEAAEKGYPVVRHPMLHYPDDADLAALKDHIMLGEEILVAPFVEKTFCDATKEWRQVYFPDAANTTWVHIFTGVEYGKGESYQTPEGKEVLSGNYRWVYAPYGTPAAFYRKSWSKGATLEANLKTLGVKQ